MHDSPDYYTLKISIFNDDKKTELIGETWADLKDVVVRGGGQSDTWHGLKCKGKYAGEVRIELTYYDSRPKVEKPASVRASSRLEGEGESPAASLGKSTPVKRRPLPSNPGSGIGSPAESARLYTSGPRAHGTPPQPRSSEHAPQNQRRSVYNNDQPRSVDHRRPLPPMSQGYGQDPHQDDPFMEYQPTDEHYDPYPAQDDYDATSNGELYGNDDHHEPGNYASPPFDQSHSTDPADFLPQLPPMNRKREEPAARRSRLSMNGDYSNHATHPPPLDHSYSAPAVPEQQYHHALEPHRLSINHARSEPYLHETQRRATYDQQVSEPYEMEYSAQPEKELYEPNYGSNQRQDLIYHPTELDSQHQDPYQPYADEPQSYTDVSHQLEPPPPPPMHRDSNPDMRHRISSSPVYGHDDHELAPTNGHPYQSTSQGMRYQSQGHPASRSELSLSKYSGPPDPYAEPLGRVSHQHHPSADSYRPEVEPYALEHHSTVERSRGGRRSHGSFHNDPYSPITSSPLAIEAPQSSWSDRRTSYQPYQPPLDSASRTSRYDPQHSQTYPAPLRSSPGTSPRHSPHGSTSGGQQPSFYDTPSRPHPLSQEHAPTSSSPYYPPSGPHTPHDQLPLIRPLAISPNKSHMSTPASQDRMSRSQVRSSTTRKSVSPRPPPSDANRSFGTPYGPDSYDQLNPANSSGTGTPASLPREAPSSVYARDAAPIVNFHGNVIDPSDRLPETNWAPEPQAKASGSNLDPSDHLPSSSWAPEPEPRGTPRVIPLRQRDRLNGARNLDQRSSPNSGGRNSANRQSMIVGSSGNISPIDGSPSSFRARLKKKPAARPQSMAVVSSWGQPIRDIPMPLSTGGSPVGYSAQAGPLVPAKVPLDSPGGSPGYMTTGSPGYRSSGSPGYAGSGHDYDSLSAEMQSIDIGPGATRRIGGRRLLDYRG